MTTTNRNTIADVSGSKYAPDLTWGWIEGGWDIFEIKTRGKGTVLALGRTSGDAATRLFEDYAGPENSGRLGELLTAENAE